MYPSPEQHAFGNRLQRTVLSHNDVAQLAGTVAPDTAAEQAGQALGLDLISNPELAAQPENAARIAAWYWTSRDINEAADSGDFVQVTRLINDVVASVSAFVCHLPMAGYR